MQFSKLTDAQTANNQIRLSSKTRLKDNWLKMTVTHEGPGSPSQYHFYVIKTMSCKFKAIGMLLSFRMN